MSIQTRTLALQSSTVSPIECPTHPRQEKSSEGAMDLVDLKASLASAEAHGEEDLTGKIERAEEQVQERKMDRTPSSTGFSSNYLTQV